MVSVFVIGLIADIWSHGRGLSLAILSSSPSWTGSVQRYSNKSPSDWGRHVPPLMVVQHLLSCRLHLYIPPGLDTYTHTHTHTHTHTQPTQAHAYIHTHAHHGDTNTNREHRSFRLRWPSPAMSETMIVGTMSCYWGSLSTFPELFCVFPRQLEAASSAACVMVVRHRVVNVEIHRRSQSQHTGAPRPQRGHLLNDRPSQGKELEWSAEVISNSLRCRSLGMAGPTEGWFWKSYLIHAASSSIT